MMRLLARADAAYFNSIAENYDIEADDGVSGDGNGKKMENRKGFNGVG